jgi:hypothetical protein
MLGTPCLDNLLCFGEREGEALAKNLSHLICVRVRGSGTAAAAPRASGFGFAKRRSSARCASHTTTPRARAPSRHRSGAPKSPSLPESPALRRAAPVGLPFSPRDSLQRLNVEHRLGHKLLELAVLALEFPQSPKGGHIHHTIVAAPLVARGLRIPCLRPRFSGPSQHRPA